MDFHISFCSSISQRHEGNKDGECTWRKQGLKSGRTEELFSILHATPCISSQLLLMQSLLVCFILPLFTVSELLYSICPRTTSIWGTDSVVQINTIANHKSESIQKTLWCYSIWASLCTCLFQTEWENLCLNIKRKSYSSWWQALDFFAGVAILMRFAAKSVHRNVRGVHTRFRWTSDCLKQGKGGLNCTSCFYRIHLIIFTTARYIIWVWRHCQDKCAVSFSLLHEN